MHRFFAALAIMAAALMAAAPAESQLQSSSPASAPSVKRPAQVNVTLMADKSTVRPGDTVTVAIRQTIAPGWHTYWRNPGDAGEPTMVEWSLPSGAAAGELQWPLPHIVAIDTLTDYGYTGEVLLLADIALPRDLPGPSADINANVKLLVCKEICVPEETPVRLSLLVDASGGPAQPSPQAEQIAAARAALPAPAPWPARFEASANAITLHLDGFPPLAAGTDVRLYPVQPNVIDNTAAQTVTFADGALMMRIVRSTAGLPLPERFEGVLAVEATGGSAKQTRQGYHLSGALRIVEGGATPVAPVQAAQIQTPPAPTVERAVSPAAAAPENLSFGVALAFAFLGGLILNLMPCVFPVLSLKALALAREAAPHERHIHASAYLLGVLISCAVLAGALITLRAGGDSIGWGTQFQSPVFVLVVMTLIMALGLNMSGVFELGGRLAGVGDRFTRVPGFTGYFFTGVLAAVVATPCTAPFMGAAVGYAFTQPAVRLLAVLLALGVGFALPMVALSYVPAAGRWLPKPGVWMATFKGAMAFPLYATVGWLLWVLSVQLGSDGVFAGLLALLGVAFAAWLVGASPQPHRLRSGIAAAVAVAAICGGIVALPASLQTAPPQETATHKQSASGLPYETFSTARLEALRAARKPVFVNLTAAWCITCKFNERVALRSARIVEEFAARGIVPLKGDWTNADPEITAILRQFGRAGVPLYLLYPADGGEPVVLPQLLTEGTVLESIAVIPSARQARQ